MVNKRQEEEDDATNQVGSSNLDFTHCNLYSTLHCSFQDFETLAMLPADNTRWA